MFLIYKIVNFKKINLNDAVKFINKYGYKTKLSLKMSDSGVGFKIYDEKQNCGIISQGGKLITDSEKEELINKYVDVVGNEDKFCELYKKCDYEFFIEVKDDVEARLAYILGIFLAKKTDMCLINNEDGTIIYGDSLKDKSNAELDRMVELYKIREKYVPKIQKLQVESGNAFNFSHKFWMGLIVSSFLAVILFLIMLFVYNVDNYLLLSLPFILIGILYGFIIFKDYILLNKTRDKIIDLRYKYDKEICELYKERTPKKPSKVKKNIKKTIINIMGFLIVPTLILGSILMACNLIFLGLIIIVFPWIVLIFIKKFITDRFDNSLKKKLFEWLDNLIKLDLEKDVVALNFNIIQKKNHIWVVEMIYCTKYSKSDNKWTLEDTKKCSLSFEFKMNSSWEEVEVYLLDFVREYVSKNIDYFKKFSAVSIGFVDGMISYIFVNDEDK